MDIWGSVPQGSILSSLLFLIYLNDIENNIKSDISLFADDVALLNKFKNNNILENEINRDLETLNEWAEKWNMDFNPAKTKMVIFSNKKLKSKPKIQLKGEHIEQVSSHKHLGVFLSQDMKWTTHIDYSVKKVKKKLGLLRGQSRNLLNRQKLIFTKQSPDQCLNMVQPYSIIVQLATV